MGTQRVTNPARPRLAHQPEARFGFLRVIGGIKRKQRACGPRHRASKRVFRGSRRGSVTGRLYRPAENGPGSAVPPGSETGARRHWGPPGTWEALLPPPGGWNKSRVPLVRHHQTKGVATDRRDLRVRAILMHPGGTVARGTTGGRRMGSKESETPDNTEDAGEGDPRRPGSGKRASG